MEMESFCLTALTMLQSCILLGVAEEELRLEAGFVVQPKVCSRHGFQGGSVHFDGFDFTMLILLLNHHGFGPSFPGFDPNAPFVGGAIVFVAGAGAKVTARGVFGDILRISENK